MQYSITLNRAHKIVERLRQHIADSAKAVRVQVSPVRVRSQLDLGAKARAESRGASFDAEYTKYSEAVATLEMLRGVISKANTANGVDALLAKQNRINQELTLNKEVLSAASLDDCVAWEHVSATPTEYHSENLASLNATQGAAIAQRVRVLQTELHAVSDQVSDANRATISFELSDAHAEIVGLKA